MLGQKFNTVRVSSRSVAAPRTSVVMSGGLKGRELASQIAVLEREIRDANSEARKAPLVAKLNALRSGSSPSSSSAQPSGSAAQQIAALEKQIRDIDAECEARKAPLVAQLNALRGGSSPAARAAAAAAQPSASYR